MRSIRPTALRLVAVGLVSALALTACGGKDDSKANGKPDTSQGADKGSDELPEIPADLTDRLKEHGIDLDEWEKGGWKNWDKDKWLREAGDFVNPVIEDHWKRDRMDKAKDPVETIDTKAASGSDAGVTDPEPAPVEAQEEKKPYWKHAAPVGKIFFETPEGPAVCSGTIVKDPNNPGKSNLVWTAGHCVHAGGAEGGWYRNIAFIPAYNREGKSPEQLQGAPAEEVAPYGQFWADWVSTSGEWIEGTTAETSGASYEYDYAVMHVKPENGGKSLEETVGAALPVDFGAPSATEIGTMGAWGYPQAPPFNGVQMYKCLDKPVRLSLTQSAPTMFRIGCTMTAGSSGGGWFHVKGKKTYLVSNTSIGPAGGSGWLAGPQLGSGAEELFLQMSEKYGKS
ncbi:trypsin-like serine peptidase [Streptomyces sp. NPDC050418]|uniref:trypsin-like serine peptidase n=1 Tax=Streptomyces sp. NPDC050418 TaxID=3365612 RepID=UPI00378C3D4E